MSSSTCALPERCARPATEMSCSTCKLLDLCAHALRAGHPAARQRMISLFSYLPFAIAGATRRPDPSPEDIDWLLTSRLGAAYIGFREAIDKIAEPDFAPQKDYATFVTGKIQRAIKAANRADKCRYLLSDRQRTRNSREGKATPKRVDADVLRLADLRDDYQQLDEFDLVDDLRRKLKLLPLGKRDHGIVAMLSEGYQQAAVAAEFKVSERTVRRVVERATRLAAELRNAA